MLGCVLVVAALTTAQGPKQPTTPAQAAMAELRLDVAADKLPELSKDYAADAVTLQDVWHEPTKHPLRAAVLQAADVLHAARRLVPETRITERILHLAQRRKRRVEDRKLFLHRRANLSATRFGYADCRRRDIQRGGNATVRSEDRRGDRNKIVIGFAAAHLHPGAPDLLGKVEDPDVLTEQDRDLCRNDCNDHDDNEGDDGDAREQSNDDQRAAHGLDRTDKRPITSGSGIPILAKRPAPRL